MKLAWLGRVVCPAKTKDNRGRASTNDDTNLCLLCATDNHFGRCFRVAASWPRQSGRCRFRYFVFFGCGRGVGYYDSGQGHGLIGDSDARATLQNLPTFAPGATQDGFRGGSGVSVPLVRGKTKKQPGAAQDKSTEAPGRSAGVERKGYHTQSSTPNHQLFFEWILKFKKAKILMLQFDGLYRSKTICTELEDVTSEDLLDTELENVSIRSYLRFYEDGTVLGASIDRSDSDDLEKIIRWFNIENRYRLSFGSGSYELAEEKITFSLKYRIITNTINYYEKITIDYNGSMLNEMLHFNIFSNYTKLNRSENFDFVKVDNIDYY